MTVQPSERSAKAFRASEVLLDSADVVDAVAPFQNVTPSIRRQVNGKSVWLKCENLQITGSFKVRGAAASLASLPQVMRARGVVACSSGNHGRAVAHVAKLMNIPATICVPEWIDPQKLAAIKKDDARVVLGGATYDEAESRALQLVQEEGLVFVGPFDDLAVIAGQGTLGLELLEDIPDLRSVVVPVSGGGLIAGVAHAVKSRRPDVQVIGVSATAARVMLASLDAGRPVALPEEETLATALAGGIGAENRYTLAAVAELVEGHVEVTENEIRAAMRYAVSELKMVVEGGGAVGLAAQLCGKLDNVEDPKCIVLSGGNVDPEILGAILEG